MIETLHFMESPSPPSPIVRWVDSMKCVVFVCKTVL